MNRPVYVNEDGTVTLFTKSGFLKLCKIMNLEPPQHVLDYFDGKISYQELTDRTAERNRFNESWDTEA